MGLSASQARLLNLTARMHDIEYKAQNLEAQKLQMANESRHVYQEYENAMNKQKVQRKVIGADGSASFQDTNIKDIINNGKYKVLVMKSDGTWKECGSPADVTVATGITDDALGKPETLRNMIEAGYIVFEQLQRDGSYVETNIATDTNLQEVVDPIELRKAEAKYEADMRRIDAKDKKFDTDLAALDNERNAIKAEMETLKSVAKENVERTFKLFS